MAKLFIVLLILHVIGDFYWQSQEMCRGKLKKRWRSRYLYFHVIRIFLVFALPFVFFSVIENYQNCWCDAIVNGCKTGIGIGIMICVPHLVIDGFKSCVENIRIVVPNDEGKTCYSRMNKRITIHESRYEVIPFIIDQVVHIVTIFIVAYLVMKNGWHNPSFIETVGIKRLVFVLMFLICMKPANLLTKKILVYRRIIKEEPDFNDEPNKKFDPQTGKLIGAIERCLIIFFIYIGQIAAIGFLITAKSILRFSAPKDSDKEDDGKDDDKKDDKKDDKHDEDTSSKKDDEEDVENDKKKDKRTERLEYILVGTFVSVSIAVVCGHLVLMAGRYSGILFVLYKWFLISFGIVG